jgi:hypothetical protein
MSGPWSDLEELVAALESVFCSDITEKTTGKHGDEMEPCADDEAVMVGVDGDDMRLTFGMIRRARAAITALR